MKKMHGIAPAAAITVALLALSGCASSSSVSSLRDEVASLRAAQQATDAKATNALATAQKAAADAAQAEATANAASQKADQIFRAGLRK